MDTIFLPLKRGPQRVTLSKMTKMTNHLHDPALPPDDIRLLPPKATMSMKTFKEMTSLLNRDQWMHLPN